MDGWMDGCEQRTLAIEIPVFGSHALAFENIFPSPARIYEESWMDGWMDVIRKEIRSGKKSLGCALTAT